MKKWLLLCLCPVWLSAQTFQQEFLGIYNDFNLVSASAMSYCEGTVAYHGAGVNNLSAQESVNSATLYRVASISKLVTAMGAMKLYEDGLLDLDADVNDYLAFQVQHPDYPNTPITARMLLNHTSGIIDGDSYFDFLGGTFIFFPPPSLQDLFVPGGVYHTGDIWNTVEPGTYFTYSNLNFGLLATVMEAVTNQRFDLFMKEFLFEPLSTHGGFNIYELPDYDNIATLYRNGIAQIDNFGGQAPPTPDWNVYFPGRSALFFAPQGGLRASASDLMKIAVVLLNEGTYLNGLDNPVILQPATLELMLSAAWTYNGTNGDNYFGLFNEWGLGVHRLTQTPGQDVIFSEAALVGHPGEAYGLLSDLYVDLENDFAFVFLTSGYFSGGNYEFGNHSAYYTVEEAVFEALENYYYQDCAGLNWVKEPVREVTPGLLRIVDILGREVQHPVPGQVYFYWYSDGNVEKKLFLE